MKQLLKINLLEFGTRMKKAPHVGVGVRGKGAEVGSVLLHRWELHGD
jgi:hypothetical protein